MYAQTTIAFVQWIYRDIDHFDTNGRVAVTDVQKECLHHGVYDANDDIGTSNVTDDGADRFVNDTDGDVVDDEDDGDDEALKEVTGDIQFKTTTNTLFS